METPGYRLKRARENLGLKFREVEVASNKIASKRGSDEYVINLSRLSDIENKGTVPSIFRLYSLCTIYKVDLLIVMEWYGVSLANQPADSKVISIPKTHLAGFQTPHWGEMQMPISLEPGMDLKKTVLLSRLIQRWGTMSISLLGDLELRALRYGFVGANDWRMFPLIYPESLVLIDDTVKKVAISGWQNEHDRPIYFLEHRTGFYAGWCSLVDKILIVLAHPASTCEPMIFAAAETDVVGQVVGVANRFDVSNRPAPGG